MKNLPLKQKLIDLSREVTEDEEEELYDAIDEIPKILEYHGPNDQLLKGIEEFSELIRAIVRLQGSSKNPENIYNFVEELADAQIMLTQLQQLVVSIDEEGTEVYVGTACHRLMTEKINRELSRIQSTAVN